ncbi:MAG TPA: type II toxin-antitoxin system RelE/ParE family toxin [Deltaproteobacteria bacterium]|nr:type II toxin-antitoxin system RelE/ParE family toxin [Deltaproteobacteria bacterium]HQI81315.1 type II toxin-antitoxin system RelE/ParE family toxin [Deltaproteobacteria bacterium]
MRYSFHPIAVAELNEAIDYYEELQSGLGFEFAKEVFSSIQRVIEFPAAWSPLSPNTRRCLVHRFPYGIIYQTLNDEILIVAIMQLNRKPSYWENREE